LTRRRLAPLPTSSGGLLHERMDGHSPLFTPEHFRLAVEKAGRVTIPPVVRENLDLQPGDVLSVRRNAVSVRLDLYRDLLGDLQRSVREGDRWSFLDQFLQNPLTSVEPDGSIGIPPNLLELAPRDRVVLEVSTEALRPALYLYRDDA
jgi:AbrB family looped-hinge helix DNA binding protein